MMAIQVLVDECTPLYIFGREPVLVYIECSAQISHDRVWLVKHKTRAIWLQVLYGRDLSVGIELFIFGSLMLHFENLSLLDLVRNVSHFTKDNHSSWWLWGQVSVDSYRSFIFHYNYLNLKLAMCEVSPRLTRLVLMVTAILSIVCVIPLAGAV